MNNLSHDKAPKIMTMKIWASLIKVKNTTIVKTKVITQNFPRYIMLSPKKSKNDAFGSLLKSAKKLDGERAWTQFIHWNESIPTDVMPNNIKFRIHTYFARRSGSMCTCRNTRFLSMRVGLTFSIVAEVEVWCILIIDLHVFCLRLWLLLVFFLEIH